jgi:hypothetical protein
LGVLLPVDLVGDAVGRLDVQILVTTSKKMGPFD